jgi:uncharacterized membrane protein YfcA
VLIAATGTVIQAAYGNVHPLEAAIVGVPAVGGVIAGTALQQRVPERAVAFGFGTLLLVSAILLVV